MLKLLKFTTTVRILWASSDRPSVRPPVRPTNRPSARLLGGGCVNCLLFPCTSLDAVLAPLGHLWTSLRVLGRTLGGSLGSPGVSSNVLGGLGELLEAPWGSLWGVRGGPWGALGVLERSLGRPWGSLGGPWGSLGGPWRALEGPRWVSGRPLGFLGLLGVL